GGAGGRVWAAGRRARARPENRRMGGGGCGPPPPPGGGGGGGGGGILQESGLRRAAPHPLASLATSPRKRGEVGVRDAIRGSIVRGVREARLGGHTGSMKG